MGSANNAASYFVGQCTYYVAQTLGWIPAGLGNAGDWISGARAKGFQISKTPVVGSAVEYAPGGGYSQYGHVAVVTAVQQGPQGTTFDVSEENYKGPGIVSSRRSTMAGVAGFILPPGYAATGGTVTGGTAAGGAGSTLMGGLGDTPWNLGGGQISVPGVKPGNSSDWLSKWIELFGFTGDGKDLTIRAALILVGIVLVVEGILVLTKSSSTIIDIASKGAVAGA